MCWSCLTQLMRLPFLLYNLNQLCYCHVGANKRGDGEAVTERVKRVKKKKKGDWRREGHTHYMCVIRMHTHIVLPGQGRVAACIECMNNAEVGAGQRFSQTHAHSMCSHSWDWELCSLAQLWPPLQIAPPHSTTAATVALLPAAAWKSIDPGMMPWASRRGSQPQICTQFHWQEIQACFWKISLHRWVLCCWPWMETEKLWGEFLIEFVRGSVELLDCPKWRAIKATFSALQKCFLYIFLGFWKSCVGQVWPFAVIVGGKQPIFFCLLVVGINCWWNEQVLRNKIVWGVNISYTVV